MYFPRRTLSQPDLATISLRLASQIYMVSAFFNTDNFSAIIFFLSGLTSATVCREADIGRQGLCCHCMSDFFIFAVCPPDVLILVEVEITLNKADLALPAIFCVKQLG